MPQSFSSSMKEELAALPIRSTCCRKAFLYGLLLCADTDGDNVTVVLPVTREDADARAELLSDRIRRQLGRQAEPTHETRGAHRYIRASFSSHPAAVLLRRLAEPPASLGTDDNGLPAPVPSADELIGFRCDECTAAFLRGAFLACGSVNDPGKPVHLEYRVPSDGRAERLRAVLASAGFPCACRVTEQTTGLYCKSSQTVADLVGALGAMSAFFRLSDAQITGSIRAQENRLTNIETLNISRTVTANGRHLTAVRGLEAAGLLDRLPPDLYATAVLRRDNPEATLAELALLHDPILTKSGLNHRLSKILAYWENANADADKNADADDSPSGDGT